VIRNKAALFRMLGAAHYPQKTGSSPWVVFIDYRKFHGFVPDGQISDSLCFCPVQPHLQKYFCFSEIQIKLYDSPSHPTEGRIAIVTNAGRDAVDAAAPARSSDCRAGLSIRERFPGRADERRCSGRRSRVVLTPRRRRQVLRRCASPTGRTC
jgi:hypothetical protein